MESIVTVSLYLSYALLAMAVLLAVCLPIVKLIEAAPSELIKLGIGIGSMLVLFFVSYGLSTNHTGHGYDKLVGAGLIMVYLLLGAVAAGILFLSLSRYLK